MPSLSRFKANILRRTPSPDTREGDTNNDNTPEAAMTHAVRQFCESGSSDGNGEEVAHLPFIVESAESSPAAAAAAAYRIRKFLGKSNYDKPAIQYNAVMLLRILSENPGPSFTKYIDAKFVNVTADVLRSNKDQSVQQILRETLDALEIERSHDEGLKKLIQMWRVNKGFNARFNIPAQLTNTAWSQPNYGPPIKQLPSPQELASRVEESKNSAKILIQLVQSTPVDEILINDLIKEFSERCQNAQTSIQGYISCDNPPPHPDTLQTLIETSEQLSLSLGKVQRAKLNARRTLGMSAQSGLTTPTLESQMAGANGKGGQPVYTQDFANRRSSQLAAPAPQVPGNKPQITQASRYTPPPPTDEPLPSVTVEEVQDPFADSAEPSTMGSSMAIHSHPPPQQRSTYTSSSPYVSSGANGPGAGPAAQPVYRY